MLRFLHLADLHLGWSPTRLEGAKRREHRARRDDVLRRAVDFALEERLDLVVIAGDLFETHKPAEPLAHATLSELRRLTSAGVALVTTPGNHDEVTYADSVYHALKDEWPGVLVMNPTPEHVATFNLKGESVYIYSLAYTGGVTPAHEPLADFPHTGEPGVHIAAFHGTLGSGDARSLPLQRAALERAGYDYVALGHIHLPSVTTLGRTPVVYSGCNEGKGFDDPGVPYWTVVEVEGGRATPKQVPCDVQPIRVLDLDMTALESPEEVEARVSAHAHADTMMRVRLTGSLHFDYDPDSLEARFASAFYHFEVRDESEALSDALLASWASQRTVLGTFVAQVQAQLGQTESEAERQHLNRTLRYGVRALRSQA